MVGEEYFKARREYLRVLKHYKSTTPELESKRFFNKLTLGNIIVSALLSGIVGIVIVNGGKIEINDKQIDSLTAGVTSGVATFISLFVIKYIEALVIYATHMLHEYNIDKSEIPTEEEVEDLKEQMILVRENIRKK